MKEFSQETAWEIVNCLCRHRAELKKGAAYWAEPRNGVPSQDAIAAIQAEYKGLLEVNANAIREISEELFPGLRLHPHLFPEVADLFQQTEPAAHQQGAQQ